MTRHDILSVVVHKHDVALTNTMRRFANELIDTAVKAERDRIEALTAEVERLRAALTQIARLRTDLRGDFSLGSKQSDIARAALGDTQ